MKKVFYEHWIAKYLLFKGYTTITLMAWVFTKWSEAQARQSTINHECIHARQWVELTVVSGLLLWLGMLVFGYSAWWMVISPVVFYAWYVVELFIRWVIGFGKKDYSSYCSISFEQEARLSEHDCNYLENSTYFAWMKFLK